MPELKSLTFCLLPLVLGAVMIGGPIVVLQNGPKLWPSLYPWIDTQPFLMALIPGAVAAVIAGLGSVWIPAILYDAAADAANPQSGAGATLIAMFILTPVIILLGPVVGAIGGLIVSFIASRIRANSQNAIWFQGVAGGGIVGAAIGIVAYLLFPLSF